MSSDIAISVKNVSKAYTIWKDSTARLKHPLLKLVGEMFPHLKNNIDLKREGLYREIHALSDISFEVKKGDSVGIIGRNGSGKSTLLQIIAGTLQPSEGSVRVDGRVAALLELGSGFNPEFTGRQNVFLNACILGLTHEETEARFSEIEAFANIGEFIDQPVKTYSSGMSLRLAFAVQSMIDPEILIIDEALAVGDYFFQQKCAARMRELRENGTTLLFVSHDMGSVRDMCQKALYLKEGKAVYWGKSDQAISYYFNPTSVNQDNDIAQYTWPQNKLCNQPGKRHKESNNADEYLKELRRHAIWWADQKNIANNLEASFLGVITYHGNEKIKIGKRITIKGIFLSLTESFYHVAVEFKNRYDQVINSTSTYTCGKIIKAQPGDLIEVEFYLDLTIEAGKYSYQLVLSKESSIPNRGERIHETPWLGPLEIEWDYEHQKAPFLGMFGIPAGIQAIRKQKYQ